MRRRKKKFNAIILKRSFINIFASIIGISFLLFSFFEICSKLTSENLKNVLSSEILILNTNNKSVFDLQRKLLNMFNSENVLAETLPVVDFLPIENKQKKEINKNDTELLPTETVQIPANTFPIKNVQTISKNLQMRNETTYIPDIYSLLYSTLSFSAPEILIVHTHGSESYKTDNLNYYNENDSDRNTDTNYNVIRIGEELANELKNLGFSVTHAKDINDYPSYNQSYSKTLDVINYYLKNNKKIQIVFDIHRDSAIQKDGTKLKFTTKINDEDVAQLMIVCGTNQAGLENDTWQENLKFAIKIQNYMEKYYPGLARPLNLRQERFNTHATLGSMIIEVGTSGNTLEEALNSAKYLAKAVGEVLKPYN